MVWGPFKSHVNLHHAGEQIYLCSSTLSGHAALMPNGLQTAICELPISGDEEKRYDAIGNKAHLDKLMIDVGSQTLSAIQFTLRDYDGQQIPLGDHNWSLSLIHI